MCRTFLMSGSFYRAYPEYAERLMEVLIADLGGHGQGIAILDKDGGVLTSRGVYSTPKMLATFLSEHAESIRWLAFHTRLATTAPLGREDLVQPFHDPWAHFTMAHVGTVHALDVWSIDNAAVSDGRMYFELATKYSQSPIVDLTRADHSGHFVGFYREHAFAIGVPRFAIKDDMVLFTSSIHNEAVLTLNGFRFGTLRGTWVEGQPLPASPVRRNERAYHSSYPVHNSERIYRDRWDDTPQEYPEYTEQEARNVPIEGPFIITGNATVTSPTVAPRNESENASASDGSTSQ